MTRRKNAAAEQDPAQAKANEYHRSIGAAMEEIADQIPADMEIQIRISSGMFEATLIESDTGAEVPVAIERRKEKTSDAVRFEEMELK
jgi:hypothetical protein